MNSNQTYWESLIGKYLSGNYTTEEEIELHNWIQADPDHQEAFERYQKIWNHSAKEISIGKSDVEEGWDVVSRSIQKDQSNGAIPKKSAKRIQWPSMYIVRTAAIVLILVLGGITLYKQLLPQKEAQIFVSADTNEIEQHMLPDGSIVWINSASEIKYDPLFQEREVELIKGEAFFDVVKNPENPFSVITYLSKTTVLGTRFNLRLVDKSQDVELFVEEGKVAFEVHDQKSSTHIVQPGESAKLEAASQKIQKESNGDVNQLSWKTKQLVFDHKAMAVVLPQIEKYFGVRFQVTNPGILNCTFRSTFDKPTLNEVLETLRIGLNAKIHHTDDHYLIDALPCH
jgi:ferric-dicitrate binding protein FerR (iron transport regulator)